QEHDADRPLLQSRPHDGFVRPQGRGSTPASLSDRGGGVNFFKLYIGDYQRDTAHLSMAEHGAYVLMLQIYYATEKPLPTGKALHRMLRAQDKAERDAVDTVAKEFWTETDDGLVNERANEEITKANKQAETNARIAQEREDRRKQARAENEASTKRATNDQPNQTPDTRHQKEIDANASCPKRSRVSYPQAFEGFWTDY